MSSANVRIIQDTKGAGLAALMKRLGSGEHRVLVGVPSGAGNENDSDLSLAHLAAIHEFGAFVAPHSRVHRQLLRRNARGRLIGKAETYEGLRGPGKDKYGPAQRVTKTRNATAFLQLAKNAVFADGITIPARPFLRGGILNNLARISRVGRQALIMIGRGQQTLRNGLETMGVHAAGAVKRYMATGNFAPNAPSTIKKKGSSQPTVDDAQLRQSVTHVVEGNP